MTETNPKERVCGVEGALFLRIGELMGKRDVKASPNVSRKEPRDTFEVVYRAAVELIYDRGYHGTSMRDIASSVGIQISSLYHHYANKQELLLSIMDRTMLELTEIVETAVAQAESPEDKLRAAIQAHVMFHALRSKEAGVTDTEFRAVKPEHRPQIKKLRSAYEDIFVRILEEGIRKRVFSRLDPRVRAYGILAMCNGVADWYREDGPLRLEQIARIYADQTLTGVHV